jgi:hypothetical protein
MTLPHTRPRRLLSVPLLLLTAVAVLGTATGEAVGQQTTAPHFRDVVASTPLDKDALSWDIDVGLLDDDALPDLVLSQHASMSFYRSVPPTIARMFRVDRGDPHACTISDVDLNGLGDVFCTRGAGRGTIAKVNHLWMQTAPRVFVDRAKAYGVTDPLGRGRHTTFFDLNGDPYPDLFIGNDTPRADGQPSPNRTFLSVGGRRFREVSRGATKELGGVCAIAADVDADGWEDLVVCGKDRLHVYRNRETPAGRRRLQDVARQWGLDVTGIRSALVADLDVDGNPDVVTMSPDLLQVYPGRGGGSFARPRTLATLKSGSWVTIGNLDEQPGRDLFVVQACRRGHNLRDVALFDRDGRWAYELGTDLPRALGGCGDVAATIDLNRDDVDEVIVLNGARHGPGSGGDPGPVQVLTTGSFPG